MWDRKQKQLKTCCSRKMEGCALMTYGFYPVSIGRHKICLDFVAFDVQLVEILFHSVSIVALGIRTSDILRIKHFA